MLGQFKKRVARVFWALWPEARQLRHSLQQLSFHSLPAIFLRGVSQFCSELHFNS